MTGTTTRAIARRMGKRTKAMARTTGLKEGELIMAARVSRVLAPLTSRLCAMGVAQLVQTPAGAPASDPQRMFAVGGGEAFGPAGLGEQGHHGCAEGDGEVHAEAVGIEPVSGGADDALGNGHLGCDFEQRVKGDGAFDGERASGVQLFEERGIALRAPKNGEDGDG